MNVVTRREWFRVAAGVSLAAVPALSAVTAAVAAPPVAESIDADDSGSLGGYFFARTISGESICGVLSFDYHADGSAEIVFTWPNGKRSSSTPAPQSVVIELIESIENLA